MSIQLKEEEIKKFWAWVVVAEGPHHLLASFHEGTDGQFHMQWRLATREHEDQDPMERKKTFSHQAKSMEGMDDSTIRKEIAQFAAFMQEQFGAEQAKILAVEGGFDAAFEAIGDHVDFTSHTVH
jgi:hypothetical protein